MTDPARDRPVSKAQGCANLLGALAALDPLAPTTIAGRAVHFSHGEDGDIVAHCTSRGLVAFGPDRKSALAHLAAALESPAQVDRVNRADLTPMSRPDDRDETIAGIRGDLGTMRTRLMTALAGLEAERVRADAAEQTIAATRAEAQRRAVGGGQ